MPAKMVVLIGEQPIPNLLPILHLKPADVLLVQTPFTQNRALQLQKVLSSRVRSEFLTIDDAYNISKIYSALTDKIIQLGWSFAELTFNVSSGTKPMAFAAYQLAADNNCPVVYLQSEGRQSRLLEYHFNGDRAELVRDEIIPPLITITDYLLAYLPGFTETGFSKDDDGVELSIGGRFEKILYQTLKPYVDEIIAGVRPEGVKEQIEIDLVVRCGNQVGIIEAKTGSRKDGIDQLSTSGGQRYLGTYTAKFLVLGRILPASLKMLAEARNVTIIELPKYQDGRSLAATESNRLARTIIEKLGKPFEPVQRKIEPNS